MRTFNILIILFLTLLLGFGTACTPNKDFELNDEVLLNKVQHQTFKYFYDFAHPVSQ